MHQDWTAWEIHSGSYKRFADSSRYAQDIEKLFNTEKFIDIIKFCGNETFFCHKNILAARNDVFAAMFDMTDSTGNQKEVVQVNYLDANTMKSLLSFIYGNKINNEKNLKSAVSKISFNNKHFLKIPDDQRLRDQISSDTSNARDIEKLFNSEKFSDVDIVCGTESFLCHKNVLAARSDVFAAMFEITDSTENHKEDVQVDDFDAKIMKTLLEFIYGNNIHNIIFDERIYFDLMFPLLAAAGKYNLLVLVSYCEDSIITKTSTFNAFEILLSSHGRLIYNKIFNKAKEVIQEQGLQQYDICIQDNENWNKLKLEDPNLAFELLENSLASEPESPLLESGSESETNTKELVLDNPEAYVQDIEKSFNSEKFSNIKIVCCNETFFCHKIILASRSDVFATMFNMPSYTENQTGVVQVDDFDAKTMKIVLSYIYGNKINKNDGDIDLLLAADKYNLPGLVQCCERSIISELFLNDAWEALLSSRLISYKSIFDAAKSVIKSQGAADIKSHNENWNKLKAENPDLAMELLEDYCITQQAKYTDYYDYDSDNDPYKYFY
jgi:hypothetical protein